MGVSSFKCGLAQLFGSRVDCNANGLFVDYHNWGGRLHAHRTGEAVCKCFCGVWSPVIRATKLEATWLVGDTWFSAYVANFNESKKQVNTLKWKINCYQYKIISASFLDSLDPPIHPAIYLSIIRVCWLKERFFNVYFFMTMTYLSIS